VPGWTPATHADDTGLRGCVDQEETGLA